MRYHIECEEDYPVYTLCEADDDEVSVEVPQELVARYLEIRRQWGFIRNEMRVYEEKQEDDARLNQIVALKRERRRIDEELKELEAEASM